MMLLLYLPFYIIPFLLFHSSILRLRLVGPDMDRYRVSNVIIIVSYGPVLAGADVVTGFTAMLLGSIDSWKGHRE